jgi:hypothetical protein
MPDEPSGTVTSRPAPLASLRRFMRPRRPAQRCELCSADLRPQHEHLLDLREHQLLCACYACAVLFSGQESGRYRRVPQRVWRLLDFQLSDELWVGLNVPSLLAFFVVESTPAARVRAMRPSRAGASESHPALETWQAVAAGNPVLRRMRPEVEALLVNRLGAQPAYYLVPIDTCYRLVGLIRSHWRGLSGGSDLWQAVERFFAELRQRAQPVERKPNA